MQPDPLRKHTESMEALLADVVETMRDYARLTDPVAFNARFQEHCRTSKTYQEAYDKTEAEYRFIFRQPKYTGYNSFRVARTRKRNRSK